MLTGLVGALSARVLFDALGVRSPRVRGFAPGTASPGIGAARAWQVNADAGAALALGIQGVPASLLLPLVFRLF